MSFSLFFWKKRGNKPDNLPPSELQQVSVSSTPDLGFYEKVVDAIVVSDTLQKDLKAKLKQAFDNPRSFYNDNEDFILSERGLTYKTDRSLTPKFVLVDTLIDAVQMTEVDWKAAEYEIRSWISQIAKAKGYNLPFSTTDRKYGNDAYEVIQAIRDNELKPLGYSLEILDINSDSYVFTIVPIDKQKEVEMMFHKLR